MVLPADLLPQDRKKPKKIFKNCHFTIVMHVSYMIYRALVEFAFPQFTFLNIS